MARSVDIDESERATRTLKTREAVKLYIQRLSKRVRDENQPSVRRMANEFHLVVPPSSSVKQGKDDDPLLTNKLHSRGGYLLVRDEQSKPRHGSES